MAAEFAMMLLSSFQKIKLSHTFNPVNLTRCKWEKSFQRQNQQVSEDLLQIKRLLETVYLYLYLVSRPSTKNCQALRARMNTTSLQSQQSNDLFYIRFLFLLHLYQLPGILPRNRPPFFIRVIRYLYIYLRKVWLLFTVVLALE